MSIVRVGVIGLGNIGQRHAKCLASGEIAGAELTAVATSIPEKAGSLGSVRVFPTGEALIASRAVDAVVIATPHYQHAALGIAALECGLHVMVEKPIAAHKADAERLIATHERHSDLVFAAMFQMRVEPRYAIIRKMIQSGELGEIVRVSWMATDWFRTGAYYASGGWRATWKGEGGGVLLNQCLHNLDMLQWLVGMPSRVRGFCQFGRFHQIEVEDEVTAYLEFPGKATGTFISSTGEAPGTNRLEIAGSRGRVLLEHDRLRFTRNEEDMFEVSRNSNRGFSKPSAAEQEIPFENAAEPHRMLLRNFANAIAGGEPLVAPGAQGLGSVELANAMVYSTWMNETVSLPLDGTAYEQALLHRIAESKIEKKVSAIITDDFGTSFRR